MSEIKKEISARLKHLMVDLEHSGIIRDQNEFAQAAGFSPGHLSEIKQGKKGLPIDKAVEICYLYGISANWLLLGKGPQKLQEQVSMDEVLARLSALENKLDSREKNGKTFGRKLKNQESFNVKNQ